MSRIPIVYRISRKNPTTLVALTKLPTTGGGRGGRAEAFEGGFNVASRTGAGTGHETAHGQPYAFAVTFQKKGTAPTPVKMRLSHANVWVEVSLEGREWQVRFGTAKGAWQSSHPLPNVLDGEYGLGLPLFYFLSLRATFEDRESKPPPTEMHVGESPTTEDHQQVERLVESYRRAAFSYDEDRPYASAPVRSTPQRTYNPSRPTRDPEGDYIPMYLARMYFQDQSKWKHLQMHLRISGRQRVCLMKYPSSN